MLEVTDRRVAVTGGEYQGTRRMTLTYPELDRAQPPALDRHRRGRSASRSRSCWPRDPSIPAGRVEPDGESLILADRAAAAEGA